MAREFVRALGSSVGSKGKASVRNRRRQSPGRSANYTISANRRRLMHCKKKTNSTASTKHYVRRFYPVMEGVMGVLGVQQGINPQASNVGPLNMNALSVYTITYQLQCT